MIVIKLIQLYSLVSVLFSLFVLLVVRNSCDKEGNRNGLRSFHVVIVTCYALFYLALFVAITSIRWSGLYV